jgi:hypothetical protein
MMGLSRIIFFWRWKKSSVLPQISGTYLVAMKDNTFHLVRYDQVQKAWLHRFDDEEIPARWITHWSELPPSPEQFSLFG